MKLKANLIGVAAAAALALLPSSALAAKIDCTQDWREAGLADALNGVPERQVRRYERKCRKRMNKAAYLEARAEGLAIYCTRENGYIVATDIKRYRGACPTVAEVAFMEGYRDGRRMAGMRQSVELVEKEARCEARHLQELQETIGDYQLRDGMSSVTWGEGFSAMKSIGVVREKVARLEERRGELRAACGEMVRAHAEQGYDADEGLCEPEPPQTREGALGFLERMASEGC